jgi:hypothetical protein
VKGGILLEIRRQNREALEKIGTEKEGDKTQAVC